MATVGEELPTHLYRETEHFSGCLRASSLARKRMLPVRVDEPFVGSLHAGLSPLRLVAIQYMSASCARGAMSELPIPVDWLLAHATWSASLFFFCEDYSDDSY